jgi:Xaa-Pro aminopeptidase
MICSNEPGYYKEGAYGIRIENLVLVTEPQAMTGGDREMVLVTEPQAMTGGDREMMGFETLTLAPIDRRLIVRDILSAEEIKWLNAYHGHVMQKVGPELDAEPRAWLKAVTAPL